MPSPKRTQGRILKINQYLLHAVRFELYFMIGFQLLIEYFAPGLDEKLIFGLPFILYIWLLRDTYTEKDLVSIHQV